MNDLLAKLFDIREVPSKVLCVIAAIAGAITLMPDAWLHTMHLDTLPREFRGYASIAFLAALAFLVVNFAIWASKAAQLRWKRRVQRRRFRSALESLDPAQKALLREFGLQQRNTLELPMHDPAVAGLLSIGALQVIGRQVEVTSAGVVVAMRISEVASSMLTGDMLGLPSMDDEDLARWVEQNRPSFAALLEHDRAIWRA